MCEAFMNLIFSTLLISNVAPNSLCSKPVFFIVASSEPWGKAKSCQKVSETLGKAWLEVRGSVHHCTIHKEKSNKMQ